MPSVPGTLVLEAVAPATKAHFSAAPWCVALFASPELVPVRLAPASSAPSFSAHLSQTQAFYKPALPPPPPSAVPSLTPYEPYRPPALSTVGQLHSLHGIASDAAALDGPGLEDLAAALLAEQARALIATDPDPATSGLRLGEFAVRHRRALKPDMPVLCRAWKARAEQGRYVVGADLVFGPGEVLASAEAVFVRDEARL